MFRSLEIACALCLVSLLNGCLDADTVVYVKKNGSGTVTETVLVSDEVAAWAGTNSAAAVLATIKRRCVEKALAMGPDVRLEAVEELHKAGMTGFKAVYTFRDVRNLAINPQPDVSMLGDLAPKQTETNQPITFGFARNGSPSLVVNIPKPHSDSAEEPQPWVQPIPRSLAMEQNAVIRTMFANFRVQLRVRVQGIITGTNSSHIEAGERNAVILMDLNIGNLTKDDRYVDKLIALGRMDNIDTARRKLVAMPNIRIEPARQLKIGFK